MRVLLTGANGFVGSHILDALVNRGIRPTLLLRPTANQDWIRAHSDRVEIHKGSLTDAQFLKTSLAGVEQVIHCVGCTKALHLHDYFEVNQGMTRHLIEALNQHAPQLDRLIYISSLAAAGPATAAAPATEKREPMPNSTYGRSKLAGEREIMTRCHVPFLILRPAAVYGPRDRDFLNLFKAVRNRLVPLVLRGRQELSLVYVRDLAECAVLALRQSATPRAIYHVAEAQSWTSRELAAEIARQLGVVPMFLPIPSVGLWLICAARDWISKMSGRPHILSRQKYAELVAPGWVSETSRLHRELGFVCGTRLPDGISQTLSWYRKQNWL